VYNSDTIWWCTIDYKYDDKKNMIETAISRSDGKSYNFTYKYNFRGNKIEEVSTNKGTQGYKNSWKYDDKGNKIEECRYYSDGHLIEKKAYTYKYDNKGNKIEEGTYDSNGGVMNKYDYDKTGNWIKKTTINNGTVNTVVDRKIVYN